MKRYIASIAIAAVAIVGAAAPAQAKRGWRGYDGYQFETKEFTHLAPTIRFVVHPTLRDLRDAAYGHSGREDPNAVFGFSEVMPSANLCIVHIVDPEVMYRPEQIGHEVAHCVFGEWHPEFTRKGPGPQSVPEVPR